MKILTRIGLAAAAMALASGLAVSKPAPADGGMLSLMAMTTNISVAGYSNTQRTLTGNYTTPKRAPAGATANMAIPSGLGLPGPIPWTIQNADASAGGSGSYESRRYWGCSPTILKGQPEVFKGSWSVADQKWTGGSSGNADPMKLMGLTEQSRVPGTYDIQISYLGKVTLAMTEAQQFLDPLVLVAPAAPDSVDTTKAIQVSWKPVPRAVGYALMAMGKDAQGRNVYWEHAKNAQGTWYTSGVAAALKAGKLKGPQDCSCTIPAGIFHGQVTLMVSGYSSEVKGTGALPAWGWAQTTATAMLGQ